MIFKLIFILIIFLIITVITLYMQEKKSVIYVIKLIIHNTNDDVLVIFNSKTKRYELPAASVAFDEIPTEAVISLMHRMFPYLSWFYDTSFHNTLQKYDRVRDDFAPVIMQNSSTCCRIHILYYIITSQQDNIPYSHKNVYPFPEFFSCDELNTMNHSIAPKASEKEALVVYLQCKRGTHDV